MTNKGNNSINRYRLKNSYIVPKKYTRSLHSFALDVMKINKIMLINLLKTNKGNNSYPTNK